MGHYERVLIEQLCAITRRETWKFEIVFNGRESRSFLGAASEIDVAIAATFLGFSTQRLSQLPLRIAAGIVGLRCSWPAPSLFHSLALSFPAPFSCPAVYTIHDLPPLRFTDEGTLPRWAKRAAQAARMVVTPSGFAKKELIELLELSEERVRVIPNGCIHEEFHPNVVPLSAEELAALGIRSRFLIYVGGFTQRKNVGALLQAWALASKHFSEYSLVLVGPRTPLNLLLEKHPAPRIVPLGHLEHKILPRLIKAAEALVYPSVYEGFGLPPLEAMALGVPVLAVRAGAVPEVVGDAALLVEGHAESLADGIVRLLEDTQLAQELSRRGPVRAARFSWKQHAERVLDVYEEVLA